MRQGQPKRIRGRSRGGGGGGGGGGGKGPNPLTRSYESNGPDVKIRGTAGTIADKYVQLSRDASSSGDPVAAENYLQHAEHYYRLLAAAQAQYQPHQTFVRADADDFNDSDTDDEGAEGEQPALYAGQNGQPHQQNNGSQQGQNRYNGQRPNNGYNNQGGYNGGRDDQRRFDRNNNERRDNRFDRGDRNDARAERPAREREEDDQPSLGLPSFITGGDAPPVAAEAPPRPAVEQPAVQPSEPAPAAAPETAPVAAGDEAEARPAPRSRRRRFGRYGRAAAGEDGEAASGESAAPAPDAAPE